MVTFDSGLEMDFRMACSDRGGRLRCEEGGSAFPDEVIPSGDPLGVIVVETDFAAVAISVPQLPGVRGHEEPCR